MKNYILVVLFILNGSLLFGQESWEESKGSAETEIQSLSPHLPRLLMPVNEVCGEDGLMFFTQQEVDSFPMKYPNCTTIVGGLCIGNCSTPTSQEKSNVHDLGAFKKIVTIGKYLRIENNGRLRSLHGFEQLKQADEVIVSDNDSLETLAGFIGLKNINGSLAIENDGMLYNLDGLDSLVVVGKDLHLSNNISLSGFDGIRNLNQVNENVVLVRLPEMENLNFIKKIKKFSGLTIVANNGLEDLTGLEHLEDTNIELQVLGNKNLKNLKGLENLQSLRSLNLNVDLFDVKELRKLNTIEDQLSINHCLHLIDLNGLSQLTFCKNLSIVENFQLRDLKGLDYIDPSTMSSLTITDNPLLDVCNYDNICVLLAMNNIPITINNNHYFCMDVSRVKHKCHISLVDESIEEKLEFYPNPVQEKINLRPGQIRNGTSIFIYDESGKLVIHTKLEDDELDLTSLNKGFYAVRFENKNGQMESYTFVKE